jgi:hypothetical protein
MDTVGLDLGRVYSVRVTIGNTVDLVFDADAGI